MTDAVRRESLRESEIRTGASGVAPDSGRRTPGAVRRESGALPLKLQAEPFPAPVGASGVAPDSGRRTPGEVGTRHSTHTGALRAAAALLLLLAAGCPQKPAGTRLGETYERIARPEVWRVLPGSQAESLGLKPGDIVLLYDSIPVRTEGELLSAQALLAARGRKKVRVTLLRDEKEFEVEVAPGRLGVVSASEKYLSSLALALEDVLSHAGRDADYDRLAALSGESFTFAAHPGLCRAAWPGLAGSARLKQAAQLTGLTLRRLDGEAAVRRELTRGRTVLLRGNWTQGRADAWGVATRCDTAGELVYGFTLGPATETALSGPASEAYVVQPDGGCAGPGIILAAVLKQALELNQAHADTGWMTGIQAYDVLIASLDTVPFCPVCGPEGSRDCFERVVWAALAHKESANRFLEDMKLALPDEAELLSRAISVNDAIIGRLAGMLRSTARPGKLDDQRRLALVFCRIQGAEAELVGVYEELLSLLDVTVP